jgi:hypothetical protein
MKSNKQRRREIMARRLERAARLAKEYATRDVGALKAGRSVPGMVLADLEVLARYNNTYGPLPRYYLDQAFTCRSCGTEEVWTAKQQKWWYEVIHGSINSSAVRCRACRQALRAQSVAHEGANLLGEQTDRLRALGAKSPTSEALAEVEAALQSKWWSLRVVAIETLGRWGGPEQVAQLEAFVAAGVAYKRGCWERVAANAATKALWLRQQSAP